jgi:adenine-specific DNA glycosylase
MWVFPMTKVAQSEDNSTAATRALGEFAGVSADGLTEADSIVHSVTRYRITLRLFCGSARGRTRRTDAVLRWVNAHELAQLPMPAAQRKLALRLKLVAE